VVEKFKAMPVELTQSVRRNAVRANVLGSVMQCRTVRSDTCGDQDPAVNARVRRKETGTCFVRKFQGSNQGVASAADGPRS
jgi:hypothetical protein